MRWVNIVVGGREFKCENDNVELCLFFNEIHLLFIAKNIINFCINQGVYDLLFKISLECDKWEMVGNRIQSV